MDVPARFLSVSYDVDGVAGTDSRLTVIAESLNSLIPSEHSGWADVGPTPGDMTLIARYGPERSTIAEAVQRTIGSHPTMLAFRRHPLSVDPIRLTDHIALPLWRRHEVYSELFTLMGTTYQLAIPVQPLASGRLRTWVFNRADTDFDDDTVELARRLQPMLAAVDAFARTRGQADDATPLTAQAGLTDRESEVLQLLSAGMTAAEIAYVTRLSPRTVQKHLEHIYAKLDVHDRVSAAMFAVTRLGATPHG